MKTYLTYALVALLAAIAAHAAGVPLDVVAGAATAGLSVFGMILSERDEFADATTITTATGRALLGDVMDSSVARNVGNGKPLYLVIQIDTAVTSAGAATVEFEFVSDAQAAIAVDGTASIHGRTGAIGKATLIAGFTMVIPIGPEAGVPFERYIGVISNPAVAALTAGKANAFLTTNPKAWKALDNGIS